MTNQSQIPPLVRPDDMPPIRTQLDLHTHWRALMGPLGFSKRTLWLMFVGPDGRVDVPLTQIDLVPAQPEQRLLDQLLGTCAQILEHDLPNGTTVAFLRSRPGAGPVVDEDVAWATGLRDAARKAGVPCRPVHVANDEQVAVVAPDDRAERDDRATG
jgi:hypothetical protein